ncbi:HNH endonuclease [Paraburkholderia bryophila]|uniref:HNH endonuclease n=1 Tax=Paraburkholderia bryophila TaxID=420952 RepID=UPI00234B1CC2|nr:HNH endonuclease signature motif containing protein [Paraburkholderia bryophila]WCM21378.1 HNH endonuclease [Paraburkholderia bryophila]
MSRLTKAQREQVRQMFGGRCAYCGEPLPDRWHADHREAVVRALLTKQSEDGRYKLVSGPSLYPERDVLENFMPSCPPCNISKHSMSLEVWRKWLAGHVNSLNAYHPIYRLAKKYGLIQETCAQVTFYFERVAQVVESAV